MKVKEQLLSEVSEKIPDARVFEHIRLDPKRNDGETADIILLHRTGVYVILLLDLEGMLYGSEATGQWNLKHQDGTVDYIPDPISRAQQHCVLLSRKVRGIGEYLKPVILYGDNTWVVDSQVSSPVTFSGPQYFLSEILLQERNEDFVPAQKRDRFAGQLTMLEMLSQK